MYGWLWEQHRWHYEGELGYDQDSDGVDHFWPVKLTLVDEWLHPVIVKGVGQKLSKHVLLQIDVKGHVYEKTDC